MRTPTLLKLLLAAAVTLVLAACSNGSEPTPAGFTVGGTVVETNSGNVPLTGVTVTLEGQESITNADGAFEFTGLSAGDYELTASLPGYRTSTSTVSLAANQDSLIVELEPNGGTIHASGALLDTLNGLDGLETEDTKIEISGNTADLLLPSELSSAALTPMTTAITIAQLQALVNGAVYVVDVNDDGSFQTTIPIDPGSNTVRLRVFDSAGDAYTTNPITVIVTFDRLDMRVVLTWDTTGHSDVDLHMFKRTAAEGNPSEPLDTLGSGAWWSNDRHAYWLNKTPTDFGNGAQNPFLDIDDTSGYGPETIILQEVTPGQYHVWVHFFNKPVANVTNAEVIVTFNRPDGTPVSRRFEKALTEDWEFWYVTTIEFPEGNFVDVTPSGAAVAPAASGGAQRGFVK